MNNLYKLTGRNVVVSGGASGIGEQCAITLSELGANIILIDRDSVKAENALRKLHPGHHLSYSVDLNEYEKIEPALADAIGKNGKVSGFVHSAGAQITLPLQSMKPDHYLSLYKINVVAGFEIARILSSKKNLDEKGGSFVFIAAVVGMIGRNALISYSASKSALFGGVKSMALELARKNIRANCVSPGFIQTDMMANLSEITRDEQIDTPKHAYPLGIGQPSDVAWSCAFLLAGASRWITGTNLVVDGGYTAK